MIRGMALNYFWIGMLCYCFIACSPKEVKESETEKAKVESQWTLNDAKAFAQKFNDTTAWDIENLNFDISYIDSFPPMDFPLKNSPFPTPAYESPGNGTAGINLEIEGKQLKGHAVQIAKGAHSEYLFENTGENYVSYFVLITLADSLDLINPVLASSRNHPHYTAQGSLNTNTDSRVDWVAAQLADGMAYAMVNMRYFDLRAGRVILAAPQKNRSIHFLQLDAPLMDNTQRTDFVEKLKDNPQVVEFFTKAGAI